MEIEYSSNFLKALSNTAVAPKGGSLNALTFKETSFDNHFCTDNECLKTLSLTVFTQKNFVANFF